MSPSQLLEGYWDNRLSHYERARKGEGLRRWVPMALGIAIPAVLILVSWKLDIRWLTIVGFVGLAIGGFGVVSGFLLPSAHEKIINGLMIFGRWVGELVSFCILAPIYVVGFGTLHFLNWVSGRDDLGLKCSAARSMWVEAEPTLRKQKFDAKMFCAERRYYRAKRPLLGLACVGMMLLVAAELFLRTQNFHDPILYRNDPIIGFALQPNQDVKYRGGRVITNNLGMRYATNIDPAAPKPANTLRILLLGDSTLFGGDPYQQKDIYSSLLEESLRKQVKPGTNVQILNAGTNAWGAFHQLGFIKRYGLLQSDALILCIPLGDAFRRHSDTAGGRFMMTTPYLALQTVFMRQMSEYVGRTRAMGTNRTGVDPQHDQLEMFELGLQAYREIGEYANREKVQVWFQIMPQLANYGQKADEGIIDDKEFGEMGGTKILEAYRKVLEPIAVEVDYPMEVFKGKGKEAPMWLDLSHLGTEGHKVYAKYLEERIKKKCVKWQEFAAPPTPNSATK